MERGDVYWFDLDPVRGSEQAGRRPAVVVSRDAINRSSPVVVIVPLTTNRGQRLYPSDVAVAAGEGGLERDSVAMALHVRVASRTRASARLGRLAPAEMDELGRALLRVLDLEPDLI